MQQLECQNCVVCGKPALIHIKHMSGCGYVVEEEMWKCVECWGPRPICRFCGNSIAGATATTSELYDADVFCDGDELLMFMRDNAELDESTEDESAQDESAEDESTEEEEQEESPSQKL